MLVARQKLVNSMSTLLTEKLNELARRQVSYRKTCRIQDRPRCDESHLQKSDCYMDIKESKVLPDHPLRELWENREECCNECDKELPRFDDLYYFISDKAARTYYRTWEECPEVTRRCRYVCCPCKISEPPLPRREKNAVIDTACPADEKCEMLLSTSCNKICMPNCKPARADPSCFKWKKSDCRKFCTPYPSFSECLKDPIDPKHPVECRCLKSASLCDALKHI